MTNDRGTKRVWRYGSSLSVAVPKDFASPGDTLWVRCDLNGAIEYSRNPADFAMAITVRLKPPSTGVVTLPSVICRTHGIKQGDFLSMYTDLDSMIVSKAEEDV